MSTNHHHVAKHHPNDSLSTRAMHAVAEAAWTAQHGASEAATRTEGFIRKHPLASAGVMLGTGAALGAIAYRLLSHQPTLGEVLADRLGIERARDRLRHLV